MVLLLPYNGIKLNLVRITPTSLRRAQRTTLAVPRSTGQSPDGWLVRPLSSTGEVEFTGCDCSSTIVMRATSGRAILAHDSKQRVRPKRQPQPGIRFPTTRRSIPYRVENSMHDKCGPIALAVCGFRGRVLGSYCDYGARRPLTTMHA
jgi:hypothetical protein